MRKTYLHRCFAFLVIIVAVSASVEAREKHVDNIMDEIAAMVLPKPPNMSVMQKIDSWGGCGQECRWTQPCCAGHPPETCLDTWRPHYFDNGNCQCEPASNC